VSVGKGSRLLPMPSDFRERCMTMTSSAMQVFYCRARSSIDHWLAQLSPEERAARRSEMGKLPWIKLSHIDDAQERNELRDNRAENTAFLRGRSVQRSVQQIIAEERIKRDAATQRDDFADLTGFERQLAMAERFGIRDNFKVGQPAHSFSLTGSSGAMCSDIGSPAGNSW
jgi:hypothetical protein